MAQAEVTCSGIMSDTQALDYLTTQGRVETSVVALARAFGWEGDAGRIRASRKLEEWQNKGLIIREVMPDRRSVIMAQMNGNEHNDVHCAVNKPKPLMFDRVQSRTFRIPPPNMTMFVALFAGSLAIGLAVTALGMGAQFAATFGRDAEGAALFSRMSWMADLAAMLLPTAATLLWAARMRFAACAALALWPVLMIPSVLAMAGFIALHVADTGAARAKTTNERAMFTEQITRLTAERSNIRETRTPAVIEAELQAAQPAAANVWVITNRCTDVTRQNSAIACSPIQRLRQALAEAARIERIDTELAKAQLELSKLPAMTSADPQAETAARMLNWVGLTSVRTSDIDVVRLIGMTLLTLACGPLMAIATMLWRARNV